jgi:hypothetical protein
MLRLKIRKDNIDLVGFWWTVGGVSFQEQQRGAYRLDEGYLHGWVNLAEA